MTLSGEDGAPKLLSGFEGSIPRAPDGTDLDDDDDCVRTHGPPSGAAGDDKFFPVFLTVWPFDFLSLGFEGERLRCN